MENNQPKKISAGLTAVIVLLLVITTIASCLGIYAWAKYTTRLPDGQTTAQVAKWHFELRNGTSQVESGKQLLALTRTDGYGHVVTGELAPGTFGEFLLEIDTTGTEVTLVYDVDITLEDCPVNLIFYKDSAHTQVLEKEAVSEGVVKLHWSKYLSLDSTADNYVNKVHLEKIYWNWPYETLDQQGNATAGDAQDKLDNGKEVQMNIVVTGTEKLTANSNTDPEEPSYAADSVHKQAEDGNIRRWDKVNYNPGSLTITSSALPLGTSLVDGEKQEPITISATEASDWVVLDVNEETGEVKIIPDTQSFTYLVLDKVNGYNNAIQAINAVAEIYLNPLYATSSRGLDIDDVNAVTGYNPEIEIPASQSFKNRYGIGENLNIVDYGTADVRNYSVPLDAVSYSYDIWDKGEGNALGELYVNSWLTSRSISLDGVPCCSFEVRKLDGGVVGKEILFNLYDNYTYANPEPAGFPVVPVVTLKPTVHMNKVNNVWQLSLE